LSTNSIQDPWETVDIREEVVAKGEAFEHAFLLPKRFEGTTHRTAALNSHRHVLRYSNEMTYEQASAKIRLGSACLFGILLIGLSGLLYSQCSTIRIIWRNRNVKKEGFKYHALEHHELA
jgi:hypothetical protein